MHPLTLPSDQGEELDIALADPAETVRHAGVELRSLARGLALRHRRRGEVLERLPSAAVAGGDDHDEPAAAMAARERHAFSARAEAERMTAVLDERRHGLKEAR